MTGARPCHICTGTALAPATSVPGLRSPLPHHYRDCARRSHTCTGTALAAATPVRAGRVAAAYRMRVAFENATETSYVITELELAPVPLSLENQHQDWAHPSHIRTRTGLTPPYLHDEWARPSHTCLGTARPEAETSAASSVLAQMWPQSWAVCREYASGDARVA